MELQEYIGKIIRQRREELCMSRYELERRTKITYNQLSNIEKGKSTSTRLLTLIFDALGLEMSINVKSE